MNMGLNDDLMGNLAQVLRSYPEVKRAVIFGSRARGDYRYNSDIDLAVYTEGSPSAGLYLDLDEASGIYKLDFIDMSHLVNEKLRQHIEAEGVQIYP